MKRKWMSIFALMVTIILLSSCLKGLGFDNLIEKINLSESKSIQDTTTTTSSEQPESDTNLKTLISEQDDSNKDKSNINDKIDESDKPDEDQVNNQSEEFTDSLVTIFIDQNSSEYKALDHTTNTIKFLENPMASELASPIRFRIEEDNVTVKLEYGDYMPTLMHFHPIMETFSATGNAGDIFEFHELVAEGIPSSYITATKDDFYATWDFSYNGQEEQQIVVLRGEKWLPPYLVEYPLFYYFTNSFALSQLMYDEAYYIFGADTKLGYFYETDHYFWLCLAEVIGLQHIDLDEGDSEGNFEHVAMEEWLFDAYIKSLFSKLQNHIPTPDDYFVTYTPERHEKYVIRPSFHFKSDAYGVEFVDIKESSPGHWEIEFWGHCMNTGLSINYLIHADTATHYDENDPFHFVISGIERLEVKRNN